MVRQQVIYFSHLCSPQNWGHVSPTLFSASRSTSHVCFSLITALHIGHSASCLAQFSQKPLWPHGVNTTEAASSKHKVQESSRTLSLRSCSKRMCLTTKFFNIASTKMNRGNAYLGKICFASSSKCAWSLKFSNCLSHGGNLNGLLPKLNLHCWNDMKLAAAKNPDLQQGIYDFLCVYLKIVRIRKYSREYKKNFKIRLNFFRVFN